MRLLVTYVVLDTYQRKPWTGIDVRVVSLDRVGIIRLEMELS